jgi:hypothetical protein
MLSQSQRITLQVLENDNGKIDRERPIAWILKKRLMGDKLVINFPRISWGKMHFMHVYRFLVEEIGSYLCAMLFLQLLLSEYTKLLTY